LGDNSVTNNIEENSSKEKNTAPVVAPVAANVDEENELQERVVVVNRGCKVVKGGKNFSFSALIVVGDMNGKVGMGFGKANEVADAIRKGGEQARKNMMDVPMFGSTITHLVEAHFRGSKVLVRPASQGTGLIAGGGMRAVLELAGVKDVLAKSLGSKNAVNVVKATFTALKMLRTRQEILAKRDRNAL